MRSPAPPFDIRTVSHSVFRRGGAGHSAGFRHPVTSITSAVDYAVLGLNPLGHYLTAVPFRGLDTFPVGP
ncbi:hypothetical protein [Geomesophilobacter sediminis]|uniref:Uncharacterized protein n=1 Tax=Geomesophilobacter sediminis TaxID=2798584 RepID=A0A8J7JGB5_9BACT|nr:hypothetical protein [Geomesophilobacter sediminis]MBJ6725709.1 hypothetical protein [Geomesophilobacter sediminis]